MTYEQEFKVTALDVKREIQQIRYEKLEHKRPEKRYLLITQ